MNSHLVYNRSKVDFFQLEKNLSDSMLSKRLHDKKKSAAIFLKRGVTLNRTDSYSSASSRVKILKFPGYKGLR